MSIRKISTQEFLKLDFKVKEPNRISIDCVDHLDLSFSASLTLATDCGVELKFTNVLLRFDSYESTNNAYLRIVTHDLHYYVFYLAVHHSEPDIALKGCVLTEEQPGSSKLNEDGYMSVVGSDEIFLTVLAQVLKKAPWQFGMVHTIWSDSSEQDMSIENDVMIAIFKMEQVNNCCQDEMEEEFEEYD